MPVSCSPEGCFSLTSSLAGGGCQDQWREATLPKWLLLSGGEGKVVLWALRTTDQKEILLSVIAPPPCGAALLLLAAYAVVSSNFQPGLSSQAAETMAPLQRDLVHVSSRGSRSSSYHYHAFGHLQWTHFWLKMLLRSFCSFAWDAQTLFQVASQQPSKKEQRHCPPRGWLPEMPFISSARVPRVSLPSVLLVQGTIASLLSWKLWASWCHSVKRFLKAKQQHFYFKSSFQRK